MLRQELHGVIASALAACACAFDLAEVESPHPDAATDAAGTGGGGASGSGGSGSGGAAAAGAGGAGASGGEAGSAGDAAAGSAGDGSATGGAAGTAGGSGGAAAGGAAGSAGEGGAGGTGGAASACASTCGTPGCGACPDREIATVEIAGIVVRIESREVTNADYSAFLAVNPATTGQVAACAGWNTSFVPSQAWPPAAGDEGLPVTWIDWCDASAYCEWSGRRLCAGVGGGTLNPIHYDRPEYSEWYRVCSNNGLYDYPYGISHIPDRCNDLDYEPAAQLHPTGSMPDCVADYWDPDGGPSQRAYDLTGNVAEWEGACTSGMDAGDACNVRGGSFETDQASCLVNEPVARAGKSATIGVRCCAD